MGELTPAQAAAIGKKVADAFAVFIKELREFADGDLAGCTFFDVPLDMGEAHDTESAVVLPGAFRGDVKGEVSFRKKD